MASINQLVSEIVHAVGDPNNIALRRNAKYAIIHTRNELIRHSYEQHGYSDKGLSQRFKISLINVPDGDLNGSGDLGLPAIKRTSQKVPRPVRLVNNLPFQSVRTSGYKSTQEIAFVKEATARFYKQLPGFCNAPVYDYINDYIYIFTDNERFTGLGAIIIESPFEYPHYIPEETIENLDKRMYEQRFNRIDDETNWDDDEFLLPEDMIGNIKDIIFKRNLLTVPRENNEIPVDNMVNR